MKRIANILNGEKMNESYLHHIYNDIEHSTELSSLQVIEIDLNTHLNNVWLNSKCRERLIQLLAYCNLRINLFKNSIKH